MSEKKDKELAKQFYTVMYRTRRFEEEVFEFYKRGLMPGLAHLYLGEEAVATGACATLRDDDYIGSTHRGHGHLHAGPAQDVDDQQRLALLRAGRQKYNSFGHRKNLLVFENATILCGRTAALL